MATYLHWSSLWNTVIEMTRSQYINGTKIYDQLLITYWFPPKWWLKNIEVLICWALDVLLPSFNRFHLSVPSVSVWISALATRRLQCTSTLVLTLTETRTRWSATLTRQAAGVRSTVRGAFHSNRERSSRWGLCVCHMQSVSCLFSVGDLCWRIWVSVPLITTC